MNQTDYIVGDINCMYKAFVKRSSEIETHSKDPVDRLVFFTLCNACKTASDVLQQCPYLINYGGPVYRELRVYYDCLWLVYLMNKFKGVSVTDVAKLEEVVSLNADDNLEGYFDSNPHAKTLLQCAAGKSYKNTFNARVNTYLDKVSQVRFVNEVLPLDEPSNDWDVVVELYEKECATQICAVSGEYAKHRDTVLSIVQQGTNVALSDTLLTSVNYDECKRYIDALPNDMFQRARL